MPQHNKHPLHKPHPPHRPTDKDRATVRAMCAYGIPVEKIAAVLDVSKETVYRHYKRETSIASAEANAKVAESLFRKATGDGPQSVAAAIFWLKTRARWKETVVNEHVDGDGNPIGLGSRMDLSRLTDEQLEVLAIALAPPNVDESNESREEYEADQPDSD